MDANRFDSLTRSLSAVGSRRRAVVLALGGAFGLHRLLDREEAAAHNPIKKCKKKSGKQKKKCIRKAKKHNASHTTDGGAGGGSGGGAGGGTGGTGGGGGGDSELCPGVDLQNDPNNCGECGRTCEFPNATAQCDGGKCVVGECEPDFYDCDPTAAGCETQLGTPTNCSYCGDVCDVGEHCGGIEAGCLPNTETNCSDGIDNDGDGNTDHADSDCPPVLQSVTVSPNNVIIGEPSLGTVQLNRPASSDTLVTLSLDKSNASVPPSATVTTGQSSTTFFVTGSSPTDGSPVTLSATLNAVTVTAEFHVIS